MSIIQMRFEADLIHFPEGLNSCTYSKICTVHRNQFWVIFLCHKIGNEWTYADKTNVGSQKNLQQSKWVGI